MTNKNNLNTSLKEKEIQNLIGSMRHEMVSLWQVVARGREELLLPDNELKDFVREAIFSLIEAGARTAIFSLTERGLMQPINLYGTNPDEIANAIITQWEMFGLATPRPPDGLWFASPDVCT